MVAQGGKADVDAAVASARAALKVWGGLRAAERGRILYRAAALLEQHQGELIESRASMPANRWPPFGAKILLRLSIRFAITLAGATKSRAK